MSHPLVLRTSSNNWAALVLTETGPKEKYNGDPEYVDVDVYNCNYRPIMSDRDTLYLRRGAEVTIERDDPGHCYIKVHGHLYHVDEVETIKYWLQIGFLLN